MKKLHKFLCYLFGHRDRVVTAGGNDRSVWGYYHCSRCGRDEAFQYDS